MSEERFIYGSNEYWVKDIENNVDLFPIDVLILLNEQDEKIKELKKENTKLRLKYMNRGLAITEAVEDLYRTEEVYLAGFNICRRITEYEREFNE